MANCLHEVVSRKSHGKPNIDEIVSAIPALIPKQVSSINEQVQPLAYTLNFTTNETTVACGSERQRDNDRMKLARQSKP